MFDEILGKKSKKWQINQKLEFINNIKPSIMSFHGTNNEEAGRLVWNSNDISFEGDVDESAKIFFTYLMDLFNTP